MPSKGDRRFTAATTGSEGQALAELTMRFEASLFGNLLPADVWKRLPNESNARLRACAPDWSPVHTRA